MYIFDNHVDIIFGDFVINGFNEGYRISCVIVNHNQIVDKPTHDTVPFKFVKSQLLRGITLSYIQSVLRKISHTNFVTSSIIDNRHFYYFMCKLLHFISI